ncbi:MAG: hypothetical protein CMP12_10710 [Zunongwangia sp.]|uniref:Uncharacterized protein n=1 Tax=Zunongwangia profunda (strain DSM 18752 / CCTCC AB 206139 / SM-A87) TaxID=655815 RepID=D5BAZ2_ZUNPS|nr:hypothetical protein [Zunongwangia profunda]ADF52505.1 hypothetical protein ZPR_2180 [Zunongwangia profunda SM-A87]MAO36356.1 hypothetical protein [Zunongwangia sp.]|tara:strand:+ start:1645 stop:2154 length:510 start_codon:yes stop_codon:yes gene_type:complete
MSKKNHQKNSCDFRVEILLSDEFKDDYKIVLTFKGEMNLVFDSANFNFEDKLDKRVVFSSLKELTEGLKEDAIIIENEAMEFRKFSQMPIGVDFFSTYLFQDDDSIYNIRIEENGEKKILLNKIFSKEHFYMSKNTLPKKLRLHYIYFVNNKAKHLASNWFQLPKNSEF